MATITSHTTRASGTVLTAAIYNSDHVNHVTNAQNLNSDKVETNAGSSVDGHAVVFDGTGGDTIRSAGFAPLDPSTAFGDIKEDATRTATGVVEEATEAEVYAATNSKFLDAGHLKSAAAAASALSEVSGSIAVDWEAFIYDQVTIDEDTTIENPTNEMPGTWRTLEIVGNDGTDRTISFGTEFEVAPSISDCDSTNSYVITILCLAAGRFRAYADSGGDPT